MSDSVSSSLRSIRSAALLKALGWLFGGIAVLFLLVLLALENPFLLGLLHFVLLIATIVLLLGVCVTIGLILTRDFRGAVVGGIVGFVVAPLAGAFWFPNLAQLERICHEWVGYSVTRITLDYAGTPPPLEAIEEDLGALVRSSALHIRHYRASRYGGHWEKDVRPGYLKLEGARLEVVTGQRMDEPHVRLLQAVFTEAFGPAPSLPSPLRAEFRMEGEAGSVELDPRGARLSVAERERPGSLPGGPFTDRSVALNRESSGYLSDLQERRRSFDLILEVPVQSGSGSLYRLGIPDPKRRLPLHFSKESGLGEAQALGVVATLGEPLMMQIYLSSHEGSDPEAMVREQGLSMAPVPWRADLARAVFPKLTAHPARVKIEPSVRFSPRYAHGFTPVRPE